jgi:hypothetical protein
MRQATIGRRKKTGGKSKTGGLKVMMVLSERLKLKAQR